MDLSQLTDQQLKQELERRKKAQLEQAEPEPLESPGWLTVLQLCKRYVHSVWVEGYRDGYQPYIFEAEVRAVYGNGIFDRLNKRDLELRS